MNERKPTVTVVTLTYNLIAQKRDAYFRQCIESVQDQTYNNIEHIVIDGASDDGTVDLIKQYADQGVLHFTSEPDDGIYDAMNKGIRLASGKYVAFLNSDDYWHSEEGISHTVEQLEKSDADFSYAPARLELSDGLFFEDYFGHKHQYYEPKISNIFFSMAFCHQTMFTKREVMIRENMFNASYKSAGDYDFIIRLCLKKYKSVFVNHEFTTYRLGGVSFLNSQESYDEVARLYFINYNKIKPLTRKESCRIFNRGINGLPPRLAAALRWHEPYFNYEEYVESFRISLRLKRLYTRLRSEKNIVKRLISKMLRAFSRNARPAVPNA